MRYIFGRVLRVVLYNSKNGKKIEYTTEDQSRSLVIEVKGSKYLSLMKDEFVIDIYNLNYIEVIKLIQQDFDNVEIYAGYESSSVSRLFSGKIFYISMSRGSRETSIAHIICVSQMARLYNSKLNLSLNSGINMYSALNYIGKVAGIKNMNLSESLKRRYFEESRTHKGTASSIVTDLIGDNSSFASQEDSSATASISLWDFKRNDRRRIKVDTAKGMVVNGPPTLSSDGVRFTSLPVFNYMPGDILLINNGIINMAISNLSEAQRTNLGMYLSATDDEGYGEYVLYQLNYSLSNSDGEFKVDILAKSHSLLQNMIGGS